MPASICVHNLFLRDFSIFYVVNFELLGFAKVLEHAGVYARTPEGKEAFLRFLSQV